MPFYPTSHDAGLVVASLLLAAMASFVTLDLAGRVRMAAPHTGALWWVGGAVVMGTGVWSMHFVGMLAFKLPVELGYGGSLTALSWLAAVAASMVALGVAAGKRLDRTRLMLGAAAMGGGIFGMHFIGMAAMHMEPAPIWNPWLVAASAIIAVSASAAALALFFRRLHGGPARRLLVQAGAALLMGAAIAGMHYTGMAAADFPAGSVCTSAGGLSGSGLSMLVGLAAAVLLGLALVVSVLDHKLQGRAARLSHSLQNANDQLRVANEELRQRALLDPLTGLPNRLLFEDRLAHALARRERGPGGPNGQGPERLAVMFVDLDGFKPVNDSFGHAAGDRVLREAAQRLLGAARDSDTLARVGGDEFLLLVEGVHHIADCVAAASRMLDALARPFDLGDKQLRISGSIGIVVYPDHGDADKLVAQADAAMYAAKRSGGGTYALFELHMDADASAALSLQSDLRHAVDRRELELYYQPKIDGKRGQINGVEALLRWHHPQRGMVSPVLFIPIAERFGLISRLGRWVIDEACRQIEVWADQGVRMRVAINLSVHQLREEDLVDRIAAALRRHHVDASQLLCEITESVAMEDIKTTQRTFDGLARIGVYLAIDDFGTGYSSLSYLRQLPARQLKIDRSFVNDLETNGDARAVVEAVVRLAHALGLRVVAEGVETAGQRDILLALACDELQGYFFARPMPAATLLEWTLGRKPADSVDFSPSVIGEAPV